MLEGAVGSFDVVGIWLVMHIVGGAMLLALACITLGDGPGFGTLSSGVVGSIVAVAPLVMEYRWQAYLLCPRGELEGLFYIVLYGLGASNGLTGGSWDSASKGGESVHCLQDCVLCRCHCWRGTVHWIQSPGAGHQILSGTGHITL